MTPELLAACLDCPLSHARRWAAPLSDAMLACGITTPARIAAFLAQIGHESGRLRHVVELWGPTPAQARYEGRKDLGNTEPGDGYRYRGRGLIQITGRANYREIGAALGNDFERSPHMLAWPDYAALSAAHYWQSRGLNEQADAGNFERITRRINGGLNGYADRQMLWQRARRALVNTGDI